MTRIERPAAFAAAFALGTATVLPPVDAWAHRSLVGHMVQHLAHTDVVAPLLLLGMPAIGRPLRVLPAPLALFLSLALVWEIHLGPLFEASLEHAWLFAIVQVLFLVAGVLMWGPVFDRERLSHAARLGYAFLAMPLSGFLGFVLYSTRAPLYAAYVHACGAGALADQQTGGEVMWVGGSALMFVGLMLVAFEFARYESRIAAASDPGSS